MKSSICLSEYSLYPIGLHSNSLKATKLVVRVRVEIYSLWTILFFTPQIIAYWTHSDDTIAHNIGFAYPCPYSKNRYNNKINESSWENLLVSLKHENSFRDADLIFCKHFLKHMYSLLVEVHRPCTFLYVKWIFSKTYWNSNFG